MLLHILAAFDLVTVLPSLHHLVRFAGGASDGCTARCRPAQLFQVAPPCPLLFQLCSVDLRGLDILVIVALLILFAMMILVELWAITVVRSCHDFFLLLHVFVRLADA